jgi:hypothetical protein
MIKGVKKEAARLKTENNAIKSILQLSEQPQPQHRLFPTNNQQWQAIQPPPSGFGGSSSNTSNSLWDLFPSETNVNVVQNDFIDKECLHITPNTGLNSRPQVGTDNPTASGLFHHFGTFNLSSPGRTPTNANPFPSTDPNLGGLDPEMLNEATRISTHAINFILS